MIDKAGGISSFGALEALKRTLGTKKVGHAGTLDPFATGLLVALSGKLTKAAYLVVDAPKEYTALFRFGEETDTLDIEGETVAWAGVPHLSDIERSLEEFYGEIAQVPPNFSAVKVDGKRAYTKARRGNLSSLPPRVVTIHSLEILDWSPPDLSLRFACSKGTYIRSVARDLGIAAGSRAHCRELRRTAIGPFPVTEAKASQELEPQDGITVSDFCSRLDIPRVWVDEPEVHALRVGRPLESISRFNLPDVPDLLTIDGSQAPVALFHRESGRFSYRIVFD